MLEGKIITFEGGEGSGKSTIIKLFTEYLKNKNVDVVKFREPGSSSIAEQIREVIVNKKNTEMCYETEALLYAAARAQLLNEKVIPLLKEDKTIIFDRFIDSSLVYQGYCRGLGPERILEMNKFIGENFPYKTFLLDLDPKIGFERILSNNRETNRLDDEPMEFHNNIRKYYLELAKQFPERIVVINANQTPEKVLEDVIAAL